MRMRPRLLPLACALVATASLAAQEPSFDVASIRPSQGARTSDIRPTPFGRFTATNTTTRSLLLRALWPGGTRSLIGATLLAETPNTSQSMRASPPRPPGGPEALIPMLRTLLVERFKLKVHPEMPKTAGVRASPVRRRDRQLGSDIRATQADSPRPSNADSGRSACRRARTAGPQCVHGLPSSTHHNHGPGNNVKMRVRRSGIHSAGRWPPHPQPLVERPIVDQDRAPAGLLRRRVFLFAAAADARRRVGVRTRRARDLGGRGRAARAEAGVAPDDRTVLVIDFIDRPSEN
jgi:hypothetical protein